MKQTTRPFPLSTKVALVVVSFLAGPALLRAGEIIIDNAAGEKPAMVAPETPVDVLARPLLPPDAVQANTAKARSYVNPNGGTAPTAIVAVPEGTAGGPLTPQQVNQEALRANAAKAQAYTPSGSAANAASGGVGQIIVVTPDGKVLKPPASPAAGALSDNGLKAQSYSAGHGGKVPTTLVIVPGTTAPPSVAASNPAAAGLEHNMEQARAWSQGKGDSRTGCSSSVVTVGQIGNQPVVVESGGLNSSSVNTEGVTSTGTCR